MKRMSPWLLGYAVLWSASVLVLWRRGGWSGLSGEAIHWALMGIAFGALTWWLTRRDAPPQRPARGRAPALQLAAIALCFLGILGTGIALNLGVRMPWNPFGVMHDAVNAWGLRAFHQSAIANGIANVAVDVLPVAVVLLMLGIKPRDLGFGEFRAKSLLVAIVWLFAPIVHFTAAVASGQMSLAFMGLLCGANFLQNGFPEEFFYRGVVMGRLRVAFSTDAALVLQALLFGFMHVGLALHLSGGHVLQAIAAMIALYSIFGLGMGYLTLRTGNIGIAVLVHLFSDSRVSVW